MTRYIAADVLFDTMMDMPAAGWTWCVQDLHTDEDLVIAVAQDQATAEKIALALNQARPVYAEHVDVRERLEPYTSHETGCGCLGHRMPGVQHVVACCDRPHVDAVFP